jgi:hypothetical protein
MSGLFNTEYDPTPIADMSDSFAWIEILPTRRTVFNYTRASNWSNDSYP